MALLEQDKYVVPLNLTFIEWDGGYGEGGDEGPGDFGTFSLGQLSSTEVAKIQAHDVTSLSIAKYLGLPRSFPYRNRRPLVVYSPDNTWAFTTATIYGIVNGSPHASDPLALSTITNVTTELWDEITDVVLTFGDEIPDTTSTMRFDQGWYGTTRFIEMDPRCSSWVTSIQVAPSDSGGVFSYTVCGDNIPRNALLNNSFPNGPNTINLDTVINVPDGTFPVSAELTSQTVAKLETISTPYHNVYVVVNQDGTENLGAGTITLLQDSRWMN